ncbi:MAG: hypothetical protein JWM57_3768 [Phycisphaerales bacterium]|nr:hypothetical protein [Phycisphaerales bacterium]
MATKRKPTKMLLIPADAAKAPQEVVVANFEDIQRYVGAFTVVGEKRLSVYCAEDGYNPRLPLNTRMIGFLADVLPNFYSPVVGDVLVGGGFTPAGHNRDVTEKTLTQIEAIEEENRAEMSKDLF